MQQEGDDERNRCRKRAVAWIAVAQRSRSQSPHQQQCCGFSDVPLNRRAMRMRANVAGGVSGSDRMTVKNPLACYENEGQSRSINYERRGDCEFFAVIVGKDRTTEPRQRADALQLRSST